MSGIIPQPTDCLPPERPGHVADNGLVEIRLRIAEAVAAGVWTSEPRLVPVEVNGIPALQCDPPGASAMTIVHFHGGAYRIGCPEQVAIFAAALAVRCGVTVICPRYRLAPEHPFPAALNDGLAVLRALVDSDCRLIVSGDSAGGGLASSLTALMVAEGTPPEALILLSPWLDLRIVSGSYEENAASDPLFSREAAFAAAALYLQGVPASHAQASPLLGHVAGFPPTLINYGLGEVLADDSRAFAAKLDREGVAVDYKGVAGMDHVAVTRGFGLPGAAETFADVTRFLNGVIGVLQESANAPA